MGDIDISVRCKCGEDLEVLKVEYFKNEGPLLNVEECSSCADTNFNNGMEAPQE